VRIGIRVFIIWFILWLGVGSVSVWFIFINTQDWRLTLFSAVAFIAITLMAGTLALLVQRIIAMHYQQKRLEKLRAEWTAAQSSLKQLVSQHSKLEKLVQLLHQFILSTKQQDVLRSLLHELPKFLGLSSMEIVVFNARITYGVWDQGSEQITLMELDSRDKTSLPQWLLGQMTREIRQVQDSLIIPIVSDSDIIAVMKLSRNSKFSFNDDEIRFMEAIANQTALALERIKLISFLENLSVTDALTGIANRRHFEWRLSEEIERARRYLYPLSALMLDLDNFKRINDTYGHIVGDVVLKQVAQRLRDALRRTDFLARYGGEEFVILAPQTPSDKVFILAERLRRVISESPIKVDENLSLQITISIGVAVFPDHAQNESELVKAADVALYKAKQSGKNRVCMFEPELVKGGEKNVRA